MGNGLGNRRFANPGWAMKPEDLFFSVGIVNPVARRSQYAFTRPWMASTFVVLGRGVMESVEGNKLFEEAQAYIGV